MGRIKSTKSADTATGLREIIADLQAEIEAKDEPWKGHANGTRTGNRQTLDAAQLRGIAQYLADNNELHATGLIVILSEHFATLGFKKNFNALDGTLDLFRRELCRAQDGILEMGLDHLRAETFKRLTQSINSDATSVIAERAQEISDHNGLQWQRDTEAQDE